MGKVEFRPRTSRTRERAEARRRKSKWYENPSVRKSYAGSSPAARTSPRERSERKLPRQTAKAGDSYIITSKNFKRSSHEHLGNFFEEGRPSRASIRRYLADVNPGSLSRRAYLLR